jgi:hypothetical protein
VARLFINSQNKLPFYTVTASVGEGGANNKIDVMLVQLMLRVASDPSGFGILPPGEQPLAVDGNCGPTTKRHIRHFQSEIKRRFNSPIPTTLDGRVDPAVRSGSANTMTLLNGAFRKRHSSMMLNDSAHITVELVNEFIVLAHIVI